MKDFFYIYTVQPKSIDLWLLKQDTNEIFNMMLNKNINLNLKLLDYRDSDNNIELISPLIPTETDSENYFLFEKELLTEGAGYFSYGFNEYWYCDDCVKEPSYLFYFFDIPRETKSPLLILALCLIVAAAKQLNSNYFIDGGCQIFSSDEDSKVYIDDFLKLKIIEKLSLEDAIEVFYRKLNGYYSNPPIIKRRQGELLS